MGHNRGVTMQNNDLLNALVNFSSVFSPLLTLITIIAAIIGVLMVGRALLNAYVLASDDGKWRGQHEPTIGGIVWSFVIGGILVTPITMVQMLGNTMLDGQAVNGSAMLYQSAGMSAQQQAALKAIFGLLTVAGYIAFIRGWVLLNKHFNGVVRDAAGTGITFVVGGVALIYLDIILRAISATTGIDFVHILFN